jgi:Ras-related protein Rab-6A
MNLNLEESLSIEVRFNNDSSNVIRESGGLLNSNLESINFEKPNFIGESLHIQLHAPEKLKIVLVGDQGVGKTSLIHKLKYDIFNPLAKSPNGYEITLMDFQSNEKNYLLQFWDNNMEEKYEKIIRAFYKDANILLVCFDLSNKISFDNIENYLDIAKNYITSNCSAFLIGTKKDINPSQVSQQEIEKICNRERIPIFKVSLLNNDKGLAELLKKLIKSK